MHPLEEHIANVIERHRLLRRSAPVIVALSGGADSVALLAALDALGYECIAAHCNFHLRGDESIRDMRHSENIARRLGVNIYIKEFNVIEQMRGTGESVEMACRRLRYDWFEELLDRDYSQAIAVAHHREDNVETFFLNLMRSSGLRGLAGMDYRRGYVIRPMLDLGRADIENYLAYRGLEFVNDSTNSSNEFRRNVVRNEILPHIEAFFPEAIPAVLAAMKNLRSSRQIIDYALDEIKARFVTDEDRIDVAGLLEAFDDETAKAFLFEILYAQGFTSSQVSDVIRAVRSGHSGQRFELKTGRLAELDRGILSVSDALSETHESERRYEITLGHDVLEPVHIQVSEHGVLEFEAERNPDIMYLDMKALADNPVFEIRRPRRGDRLRPFGMSGEKLVSDVLKDAKLTASAKRHTWLLTRNGKILWIIGLRASAFFTVTPDTRRYLRLRLNR